MRLWSHLGLWGSILLHIINSNNFMEEKLKWSSPDIYSNISYGVKLSSRYLQFISRSVTLVLGTEHWIQYCPVPCLVIYTSAEWRGTLLNENGKDLNSFSTCQWWHKEQGDCESHPVHKLCIGEIPELLESEETNNKLECFSGGFAVAWMCLI